MMTISERRKRSSGVISVFPRAEKATRLTFPNNYKPEALQFLDQMPGCLRQSQKQKSGVGSRVSAAILLLLGDAGSVPAICSSQCRVCHIGKLRGNMLTCPSSAGLDSFGHQESSACCPHVSCAVCVLQEVHYTYHHSRVIFVNADAPVIRITVDQNLLPNCHIRLLWTQT